MFEAHFQTFEDPEAGVALTARLSAFREELARRRLTGFVVPRADQQQNEYVPPSEERLAWLTGFTGSAGLAIVLAHDAAIFVDGRYTLQAGRQVDTKAWAVESLIEPPTRGDPESPLRWTWKSTRRLAEEMARMGHAVARSAVAALLHAGGYSLQANPKTREGCSHPDRDAQFRYIEGLVEEFRAEGLPVLSVDTKKKELVGNFGNPGAVWVEEPYAVNAHDFRSDAQYRAVP